LSQDPCFFELADAQQQDILSQGIRIRTSEHIRAYQNHIVMTKSSISPQGRDISCSCVNFRPRPWAAPSGMVGRTQIHRQGLHQLRPWIQFWLESLPTIHWEISVLEKKTIENCWFYEFFEMFLMFLILVGALEPWNFMTFHMLGISSSQLTNSYFPEG